MIAPSFVPVASLLLAVSCGVTPVCKVNLPVDGAGASATGNGQPNGVQLPSVQPTGGQPGAGKAGEIPPETPPTPSAGATQGIHVSPSGDNATGDGSAAKPYRSIQHVLDKVAGPGSVVLLHQGTYKEEVRIRHSNLTLQSAPGERAHITCPVSINENDPILCVEIDAETAGVKLRALEVSGGFYAIFLGSQWDYDDTPLDNRTAHNVLIEDCILHDTGRDVVKIPAGCDDVTIRRCEIYNSGIGYRPGTPQDEKNAEGIDAVNADRLHVADSHIHDTATSCIYAKGGSIGTVIERTRVERCGDLGIVLGFDTSPEFFDRSVNPEYYENIGGVVRNCVIADTGLAGLGLYATRDAHLLHNTVLRGGSIGQGGIYLGVATQDYDPLARRPANTNPTIVGNVIDQTGLKAPVCFGIRHTVEDQLGTLSGLASQGTIRDNLYFSGGAPCVFNDSRPESLFEGDDLAAWQAHAPGFDAGSRRAAPMLTADGHLSATSPAINAISPTPGVTYDIDGALRGGSHDLGADEI